MVFGHRRYDFGQSTLNVSAEGLFKQCRLALEVHNDGGWRNYTAGGLHADFVFFDL